MDYYAPHRQSPDGALPSSRARLNTLPPAGLLNSRPAPTTQHSATKVSGDANRSTSASCSPGDRSAQVLSRRAYSRMCGTREV